MIDPFKVVTGNESSYTDQNNIVPVSADLKDYVPGLATRYSDSLVTNKAKTPVKIISMTAIETGKYNPVYGRSTLLNMSQRHVNNISEALEKHGGRLTPVVIAKSLAGSASLSNTYGEARIPNGWDENRFRFILITETDVGGIEKVRHFFTGYSEYYDLTPSKNVDMKMLWYVNKIIEITYHGRGNTVQKVSSFNIIGSDISEKTLYEIDRAANQGLYLAAPTYMLHKLANAIEGRMAGGEYGYTNKEVKFQAFNQLGNTAKTIDNTYQDPSHYAHSILNAYALGKSTSIGDVDPLSAYITAENELDNPRLTRIPLLRQLSVEYGDPAVSYFSLEVLNRIYDDFSLEIMTAAQVPMRSTRPQKKGNAITMDAKYSESMLNSTVELNISTMLKHALSKVGFDQTIRYAIINIDTANTEHPINISNVTSYLGTNVPLAYIKRIESILHNEIVGIILPEVTMNGRVNFECLIHFDLFKEFRILISVDGYTGQEDILFVFPMFADSTYNPNIATPQHSNLLEANIANICGIVDDYYDAPLGMSDY